MYIYEKITKYLERELKRAERATELLPDTANYARLHQMFNVKSVIENIIKMKETFKFEKIDKNAHLPQKSHPSDAGWDVKSTKSIVLPPQTPVKVPTGLKCDIPNGWEIQIRSRSGLALKGIVVLNSPGTIDSGYRGEIQVLLMNTGQQVQVINEGDRIAQLIFSPVYEIDIVEEKVDIQTDRGDGGFGSTGK